MPAIKIQEMIKQYLNSGFGSDPSKAGECYFKDFQSRFTWHRKGEKIPSQMAQHENYLAMKWWLKETILMQRIEDEDVKWVFDWVNTSSKHATQQRIQLAYIDREIDMAPILLEQVRNDCAHRKNINGVEVQLDKDQLKHQPKGYPIGDREKSGGEKFDAEHASIKWHEDNTMKYMADWANGLGTMEECKKVSLKQSDRHYLDGFELPVSFEGYCIQLKGVKYVSFHCYPNSR
jgi:hypothetical protein